MSKSAPRGAEAAPVCGIALAGAEVRSVKLPQGPAVVSVARPQDHQPPQQYGKEGLVWPSSGE